MAISNFDKSIGIETNVQPNTSFKNSSAYNKEFNYIRFLCKNFACELRPDNKVSYISPLALLPVVQSSV